MRGIDSSQEQKTSALLRDTRSLGQRIGDMFTKPMPLAIIIMVTASSALFMTAIADLLIVLNLICERFGLPKP